CSRQGKFRQSKSLLKSAIKLSKETADWERAGGFLIALATVAHHLDNDKQSLLLNLEAIELLRLVGDKASLPIALNNLGLLDAHEGDILLGEQRLKDSMRLAMAIGADPLIMTVLESFAEIACLQGRFERAMILLGAADAGRRVTAAAIQVPNKSEC